MTYLFLNIDMEQVQNLEMMFLEICGIVNKFP